MIIHSLNFNKKNYKIKLIYIPNLLYSPQPNFTPRPYPGLVERENLNLIVANDRFELDEAEVIWSNNENVPIEVKKSISGNGKAAKDNS